MDINEIIVDHACDWSKVKDYIQELKNTINDLTQENEELLDKIIILEAQSNDKIKELLNTIAKYEEVDERRLAI